MTCGDRPTLIIDSRPLAASDIGRMSPTGPAASHDENQ